MAGTVIERRQSVATGFGVRVVILAAGHLIMMAAMFALIETYEPSGFRFNSFAATASFAVVTLGPVAIGLFVKRSGAVVLIALLQAVSPLALLPDLLETPQYDLSLALLLWWYPLPVLAALILAFDQFSFNRHTKRVHAAENLTLPPPSRLPQ